MFITSIILIISLLALIGKIGKDNYKIGYYERKLKLMGEDISHVENCTVLGILRDPI